MKKLILGASLAAAIVATPVTAATLTAQDIQKLAPGRYLVSVLGVKKYTISFQPNGTLFGVKKNGKTDTGVWSVQGQKLCIKFTRWLKGKTRCSSISGGNGSYSGSGLSIRKI
jgi:hypothetical protein